VYGWLWRRLTFGTPWRVVILVLLAIGVAAMLWYVVFPAVDRYLPANEVSVTSSPR
jgi:hypothetical protein